MNENTLKVASRTDPGRVRKFNEDSIASDVAVGVVALADGLGPQKGAEIAARIATTAVIERLRISGQLAPRVALRDAIGSADRAIRGRAHAEPAFKGMGSTLSVAWFHGDRVLFAHIGDSRIYRLRGGALHRMTSDHSFLQEQLARGGMTDEEARVSQSRHFVTRALGATDEVAPDMSEQETAPGDLYLLCSDGLHDVVEDADISLALELLDRNLELAADTLVAMANDRGGRDNISVILVKLAGGDGPPEVPGGLKGWFRSWMGG